MRKTMALLLGLTALLAAGEEKEETVRALRYRIQVFESAIDLAHGGGQWITELYFPEEGVVCNLQRVPEAKDDGTLGFRDRLHAFHHGIRNRCAVVPGGKETEQPTTEVAIPASVARAIFELAEVTRKQRELAAKGAELARAKGIFGS